MKKRRNIICITGVLLIAFIIISIFTFIRSNQWIEKGFLSSEGNAAQNFAALTAASIHLSDERVEQLKKMPYSEVLQCEENELFRMMMKNKYFSNKVDYAYIMVALQEDEVRYQVTEENNSFFDAPDGTNLDIMWLLDINVSETASETTEALGMNAVDEIQRYSYYIPEDDRIFGDTASYIYQENEWGNHICGYAPLFSTEGTYIGALGVELQTSDFESYKSQAMMAMGVLLVVASLTLLCSFVFLYWKYSRMQFEQIHTDALTKIHNRTYFNNCFIRKMNARREKNCGFALLILDIDFFKKVNDTFGHEIGDAVLIEIAELMKSFFGMDHVARFGGEEFVGGFWAGNPDAAEKKLEAFLGTVRNHKFSVRELDITVSAGVSFAATQQMNGWLISEMLRAADKNLYYVKENGRNGCKATVFRGVRV